MGTIPPADRRDPTESDADRCIPAADRTAFALGQFLDEAGEARRAAISRHLLRCPACRADVDAISIVGSRLASFGAGGDWEADIGAALAAERGRARLHRRAAFGGVAAAAVVVAALTVGLGRAARSPASDAGPVAESAAVVRPATAAAPRSKTGSAAERAQLLASQAEDGRFAAAPSVGGGRHDEAATGLAVLALVEDSHGVPRDAAAARAVAAAVRWLRTRQGASGRFGPEATSRGRDQAIATAALLEVGTATGDATLKAAADRGVRALRRDVGERDQDARGWVRYALSRARDVATGHARDPEPAMGDAVGDERWPAGLADDASLLGRTLAVVDRTGR